jgi:hypothetical protein
MLRLLFGVDIAAWLPTGFESAFAGHRLRIIGGSEGRHFG